MSGIKPAGCLFEDSRLQGVFLLQLPSRHESNPGSACGHRALGIPLARHSSQRTSKRLKSTIFRKSIPMDGNLLFGFTVP